MFSLVILVAFHSLSDLFIPNSVKLCDPETSPPVISFSRMYIGVQPWMSTSQKRSLVSLKFHLVFSASMVVCRILVKFLVSPTLLFSLFPKVPSYSSTDRVWTTWLGCRPALQCLDQERSPNSLPSIQSSWSCCWSLLTERHLFQSASLVRHYSLITARKLS